MNTQQWYKVTRKDGNIQYATKYDDTFFLWGSGFGVSKFDAVSVEPIDGFPPVNYKGGITSLDDWETSFACIIDANSWWNGWANPWILAEDIGSFIKYLLSDGGDEFFSLHLTDDSMLRYEELGGEGASMIPAVEMYDGKKYYYLGGLGLTFCFKLSK